MIVRLLLWRLSDSAIEIDRLRSRLDELAPLHPPSAWLWNAAHDRFGLLLVLDEDEQDEAPPQLAEVRALLGRDPDLYDEFDVLS